MFLFCVFIFSLSFFSFYFYCVPCVRFHNKYIPYCQCRALRTIVSQYPSRMGTGIPPPHTSPSLTPSASRSSVSALSAPRLPQLIFSSRARRACPQSWLSNKFGVCRSTILLDDKNWPEISHMTGSSCSVSSTSRQYVPLAHLMYFILILRSTNVLNNNNNNNNKS